MKSRVTRIVICAMGVLVGGSALQAAPTAALKNFEQIYEGLLAATGITNPPTDLQQLFANVRPRLPKTGSIDEMNGSIPSAQLALTHRICQLFVDKEKAAASAARVAFGPVDFAAAPSALSDAARTQVVQNLAGIFLPQSLSTSRVQIVNNALTSIANLLPKDATGTPLLMVEACSIVGASFGALMD